MFFSPLMIVCDGVLPRESFGFFLYDLRLADLILFFL